MLWGHFTFTKHLHSYLFSLTKRNLKKIFTFTRERKKQRQCSAFVLQWSARENCRRRELRAWPCQNPPGGKCSASQHQAATASGLRLTLFCIMVSKILASPGDVQYQRSLSEVTFWVWEHRKNFCILINGKCFFALCYFWLMNNFMGMLYFWMVGETCISI